jgi:osmotically-inducible protein OsmY
MSRTLGVTCLLIFSLSIPMAMAKADLDLVHDQPLNFVNDSPITAAVKAKLNAAQLPSLATIKIGIDDKNVVWLSGTADTQAEVNLAESIARSTVGVVAVNNNIRVKDK